MKRLLLLIFVFVFGATLSAQNFFGGLIAGGTMSQVGGDMRGGYNKLGIVGGECTPDGKFSLDACRCVGACGLAPVMMVNDDVYGRLTVDDIDDILAKYE